MPAGGCFITEIEISHEHARVSLSQCKGFICAHLGACLFDAAVQILDELAGAVVAELYFHTRPVVDLILYLLLFERILDLAEAFGKFIVDTHQHHAGRGTDLARLAVTGLYDLPKGFLRIIQFLAAVLLRGNIRADPVYIQHPVVFVKRNVETCDIHIFRVIYDRLEKTIIVAVGERLESAAATTTHLQPNAAGILGFMPAVPEKIRNGSLPVVVNRNIVPPVAVCVTVHPSADLPG